ncbi:PAS domain S-box-containing protein/diguanylate cyclase (GGDEF)-like protein [Desulfobotulus alkaliphilus]|uniref:PAS domain S-box-containing protein/diguanylate cyclase (GGDEF)-like protein n=1 Tax=Desulfobotulus alkaliphilus TaxID=622671 RepID=A0A562RVI5_9BACT|nr:EAL domain-containing protein [Desulfobotulus alkaliphilus]TWI73089.1 PAS domain S-box-containing protein/diguanylate cyclase (GGDEF)-like protein [Desulfobotulus alkaliphilus]
MSFIRHFQNLPIRNRMLVSYLTLFILALSLAGLGAHILLRITIENHIRDTFQSTTGTIHNLVRTAADVSIRNHLRTVVETNTHFLHTLHTEVMEGKLSSEDAKKQARSFFHNQPIGHTGYVYVLNSEGILQHHMDESLVGEDMSHFEFVGFQKKNKDGYIEYDWKNPGENETRPKALHMGYFEPWDWIVSASSYREEFRDLLRVEDFRKTIEDLKFGETGYAMLLDTEGELLIHPIYEPQNIEEWLDSEGIPIIRKILNTRQTTHYYSWQHPGEPAPREKVVLSAHIPELDLVVAATGYMEEFNRPLKNLGQTLAAGIFICILALIPLTVWLGRSITKPIESLVRTMQEAEKGDFSIRAPILAGEESGELARCFNHFMDYIQRGTNTLQREIAQRRESEEKARALARFPDENPNPVMRIRKNFTLDYMNRAAMEQLRGENLSIGKIIPAPWQNIVSTCMRTRECGSVEAEVADRIFLFTASPLSDGNAWYLYGHEITEKKAYERLLLLSDTVFENTIEGICITDADMKIERINPAFTAITGYGPEEVMGQNPRILKSDVHPPGFYKNVWTSLLERGEWSGEIWNRRKNGETYPQWLAITGIPDEKGKIIRYMAVFHDISELKTSKEALHFQTFYDALTGLANRRLLTEQLERSLSHAKYHKEKLAVFFLDIDNFKNVNDSLGHLTGDRILKEVARRLTFILQEDEILARFAGDKFILASPRIQNSQAAITIARRIRETLEKPFDLEEREYYASLSMGIAIFPDDGKNEEILIKNAETAMYRAKQTGKNTFTLFSPEMNAFAIYRMDMESQLRKALENNEFHLVYQPKVDLYSGKIIGAEALLRWQPASGPPVSPMTFIPIAEETGLILPIGSWVLEKAMQEAVIWKERGFHDLSIAINISPSQFQQQGLTAEIDALLKKTGLRPEQLELELTESIIMQDAEAAIATLSRFNRMGIRFAIDDFGTGYSSLSYLKRFPIQVLKIDKSFIQEIPANQDDASIVLSILSLAHNLGLKVVAEGVETEEQLAFLRCKNCDMIQGYLFSKPLLPEDFRYLIAQNTGLLPMNTG